MVADPGSVGTAEWIESAGTLLGVVASIATNLIVAGVAVITMMVQSRDLRFQVAASARHERQLLRDEKRIVAAQSILLSFAWCTEQIKGHWRSRTFDAAVRHLQQVNTMNAASYRWLAKAHEHAGELWGLVSVESGKLRDLHEKGAVAEVETRIDTLIPRVQELLSRIDHECQAVIDGPGDSD